MEDKIKNLSRIDTNDLYNFSTLFIEFKKYVLLKKYELDELYKIKTKILECIEDIENKINILFDNDSKREEILNNIKFYARKKIENLNIVTHENEYHIIFEKYQRLLYAIINVKVNIFGECNKEPCHICLENPINIVAVPCGHTLCSKCSSLSIDNRCYFCRGNIKKYTRLYI